MRLKEVHIQNFRNIEDLTIQLGDRTVLIGENNSGKTAIIEAIRAALSRNPIGRINPFDEYDYRMVNPEDRPETVPGIRIELLFKERTANVWPEPLRQALNEIIQTDPQTGINSISLRLSSEYDTATKDFPAKWEFLNLQGQPLGGRGASATNYSRFLSYVYFYHLPAQRDSDQEFSPRSRFWGRLIRGVKLPADAVEQIEKEVESLNTLIMQSDASIQDLNHALERVSEVIRVSTGKHSAIASMPLKPWEFLSRSQPMYASPSNPVRFPLAQHGHGLQSLSVIVLMQAYVEILMKEQFEPETEAILAIEEPEAHLHPQAIRAMGSYLGRVSFQSILTTHSPHLIQEIPSTELRLVRQYGQEGASVKSLPRCFSTVLPLTNSMSRLCHELPDWWDYNPSSGTITLKRRMTHGEREGLRNEYPQGSPETRTVDTLYSASQLFLSEDDLVTLETGVKRIRGEILFARGWLLCEGPSEFFVLKALASKLNTAGDASGVSIIDFQNNGPASVFIALAETLGIPWVMTYDNDSGGRTIEQEVDKLCLDPRILQLRQRVLPGSGTTLERFLLQSSLRAECLDTARRLGAPEEILSPTPQDGAIEAFLRAGHHKVQFAARLARLIAAPDFDVRKIPQYYRELLQDLDHLAG